MLLNKRAAKRDGGAGQSARTTVLVTPVSLAASEDTSCRHRGEVDQATGISMIGQHLYRLPDEDNLSIKSDFACQFVDDNHPEIDVKGQPQCAQWR